MTVKIDGTNTVANPAFTGADTDTGLQCGTNELNLVTGGTARATVDSSGNVGIGTTSPAKALHIDSGSDQIRLSDGTGGFELRAGNIFKISDDGTERMRIQSGGGISFNGDTAAANALDDYEEGTWTPVIKSGTNTISYSGGDQQFRYTKIGRKVTVYFSLNGSTTSGTTGGACTIEGMPFAMASDVTQERTMGSIFMFYSTGFRLATFPAWPHMNSPNTKVEFYNKSSASAQYNQTNVDQVGTQTYCFFQITYQVA